MKHLCRLLVVLLLFNVNGQAQKKNLDYKIAVNVSPLSVASMDNMFLAGIEHRLAKGWALAADAGYIFNTYYLNDVKKTTGFELRPAIRYYHGRYQREYWQLQLFYKKVNYQLHDWLGKDIDEGGIPAYEQLQDFTFRKQVISLSIMAGETIPISDRIFIDVYGGFGARYKEQAVTEHNSAYSPVEDNTEAIYGPKVWSICVPVGVKLAVKLK